MFKFDNKVNNKEKKKKSFVWLIIYMCVGAIIGGIIGFVTSGNYDLIHNGILSIGKFVESYAFEIYAVTNLSILFISLVLASIGKKRFMESVAREDEVYDEDFMSIAMGATGLAMMTSFILLIPAAKVILLNPHRWQTLATLAILILVVVVSAVLQNRIVEDMKKAYPEKRGDVYDMNFKKDLIASFDEREKSTMHEAGFKAYEITSKLIFGLTIGILFLSVFIDINLGLVFTLLAIMATMNITYVYYCIKLEKVK